MKTRCPRKLKKELKTWCVWHPFGEDTTNGYDIQLHKIRKGVQKKFKKLI